MERYIPATNESVIAPKMIGALQSTKIPDTTKTTSREAITDPTEVLKAYLRKVSSLYGVDYPTIERVIQEESSFNPKADNGLSAGISQIKLETWLGSCGKTDERKNPYKSIDCMARLWSQGYEYWWDYYCNDFYDEKCVEIRGLYPGFLNNINKN